MNSIEIIPAASPVDADVQLPGSKSITNRALILAALASGKSHLSGALFSDDTRYMLAALGELGFQVSSNEADCSIEIEGCGGTVKSDGAHVYVGNAGTAARFLTALFALGHGKYHLDGIARMRQRPIQDLLDALHSLGANAFSDLGTGCPPVTVIANGIRGGSVSVRGDASSQFLSALLMVAPCSQSEITITVEGELVSKPYIDMTISMMQTFGASVINEDYKRFVIAGNQRYRSLDYQIEPDASGASYFFAAGAVTGGRVRVLHLGSKSLQGDLAFTKLLGDMGCAVRQEEDWTEVRGPVQLNGLNVDMNAISDTVMTLAAIAPFASGATAISNIAHIRHKETDRISAVATELRKLGVEVTEESDGLLIQPASKLDRASIDTYDDHRMAMSFAITGLRSAGVVINDPGCTTKTFPDFFERLFAIYSPKKI